MMAYESRVYASKSKWHNVAEALREVTDPFAGFTL
jgi:hypothetical protein